MKTFVSILLFLLAFTANAQSNKVLNTPTIVEASCGECQFGMKGKSCDLAIRIDNKSYFVDGTAINDHGNAHASNGFCNAIRKATVTGKVIKNRFKTTSFNLIEE